MPQQTADIVKGTARPVTKPGVLPIYAVTPFTMLGIFRGGRRIIWFTGCNMRCPYCHNPQIVKGKGRGDIEQVMAFLKKRQGLLDGVVSRAAKPLSIPACRTL